MAKINKKTDKSNFFSKFFILQIHNIQAINVWRTHTKYMTNGLRLRGEHSTKCQRTIREMPTYTHEICNEHTVRRRGPIHRARILT